MLRWHHCAFRAIAQRIEFDSLEQETSAGGLRACLRIAVVCAEGPSPRAFPAASGRAVEQWALLMNFAVNDLALFVARLLRYGGHRDAPPWPPLLKGGKGARGRIRVRAAFRSDQRIGCDIACAPPPLAPPSKGGEGLRNTRGGKSSFVRSRVFNSPARGRGGGRRVEVRVFGGRRRARAIERGLSG